MSRCCFAVLCLLLALPVAAFAADLTVGEEQFLKAVGRDCPVVRLWPAGSVPDEPKVIGEEAVKTSYRDREGLLLIENVSNPSLTILSPRGDNNTGVAIVFCPGGGYGSLACDPVRETAAWMNERGITVVLLKYRVPKRHHDYAMNYQPLQDAQRAIGILRTRAAEWQIDPHKIGIGGFSAGGHLAASLAINHEQRWYKPVDQFDTTSCRPDFAVLLYPAYLTEPPDSNEVDPDVLALSRNATPPMFMSSAKNDAFTRGMLNFYLKVQAAGLPAECHVYAIGGHGGGIDPISYPASEWTKASERWLRDIDPELERQKTSATTGAK